MSTVPAGMGVLQIEPTDHCNLACAMCAPHADAWPTVHGVPKGWMDMALFRRVIDGLAAEDCRFDHLILQWLGDPSLHEGLEEMAAYAGRVLAGRLGYVRFDTNGLLLGPERIERLLATVHPATPLLVVFTLDAASADTYRRVKGRDGLALARRHVRRLLSARRHRPVNVQVQFVVQEGNAHEAGAFLRYWTDAFACHGFGHGHGEILFKPLSVEGGGPGQAAADRLYRETLDRFAIAPSHGAGLSVVTWTDAPWQGPAAREGRGPCPGLWFTPVVRHDGTLLLCCADLGSTMALGNLGEHGFRELWYGPAARRRRLEHMAGRFTDACASCGGVNWFHLEDRHLEEARAGA
jgi:MoaA/NifB/PqqE/SkfB family radical SAM enzyme